MGNFQSNYFIFVTQIIKLMSISNVILICISLFLAAICSRLLLRQQPKEYSPQLPAGLGLQVCNNDVMHYIKETTKRLMPLIESKKINLKIKCEPDSMMGWIDTELIDNTLLILLSDISKRVGIGGKVSIMIYTSPRYDRIYMRFIDNGLQMSKRSLTVLDNMVTYHHGSIKNNYFEKEGNTVVIEMPIKKDAYRTEEQKEMQPTEFNIPNNIELHVPTIELPDSYEEGYESIRDIMHTAPRHAEQEYLQRAIKCVNEHISDTEYDRQAFASDMGSSISTLYNKIRAITGKSLTNFTRDIRIEAACQLAKENPDWRVSDIAYQVGFKDPKYFATSFKRVMGTQPKEYFAEIREEAEALSERNKAFSIWDKPEPKKS